MSSPLDEAFDLVPDEPIADEKVFDAMSGQITGAHDILRFQMADLFVKELEKRRKEQNARIRQFAQRWQARKAALRDQLLEVLEKEGTGKGDARKIKTMLGTTFRRVKEDWSCTITDEDDALEWLIDNYRDEAHVKEWVVLEPKLTSDGRAAIKHFVINGVKATGEIPKWAEVSPPGFSVANRLSPMSSQHKIDEGVARSMLPSTKEEEDE